MVHRNAPLTETGRLRLARCVVEDGWPLRRAAERFQVSHTTAARWAARYRQPAPAGMADRSSPAARQPGPHAAADRAADRRPAGAAGGWARPGSRSGWAWRPRPCTRSWPATAARGWRTWTGPPARAGPPLRARPARRAGPRRRQEARQHPRRRRLAHPGPRPGQAQPQAHRDPAAPQARRRSWATATCTPPSTTTPAWPTPRSSPTSARTPPPRSWPAPHAWFAAAGHHHRTRPHRQRLLLPVPRPGATPCADAGHHPQAHPALPAADQRQSRTLPPHPARRMGLRPALPLRNRTPRRP